MAAQNRDKLNQLQRVLPEGAVAEARWLEARGYTRSLRQHYVARGWLVSPARGVFARPGPPLRWESVVLSLQSVMSYDVIVGGRTALELQGFGHYVRFDEGDVHLYAEGKLPGWLDTLPLDASFVTHKAARLFPEGALARELVRVRRKTNGSVRNASIVSHVWGPPHQPILLSSPERAVLEMLDELPAHETFHQVDMIFESLTTLRPARLQALLGACRSVKVKRLFFWLARHHRHAWLARLDETAVDLGSGKRALVPGGKLDPRYLITVPKGRDGDL